MRTRETNIEREFEDFTKEEKMVVLALYINHPFPQSPKQIRKTIYINGWEDLNEDDLNQLRITLVQAKYN
jgi:hypothetical protein